MPSANSDPAINRCIPILSTLCAPDVFRGAEAPAGGEAVRHCYIDGSSCCCLVAALTVGVVIIDDVRRWEYVV